MAKNKTIELEFAFFANAAEVSEKGLINVLGGCIDFARGPMFPAPIHSLWLIAKVIAFPEHFDKQHDFMIEVFGPDDNRIAPDVHVPFTPKAHARKPGSQNWMMITVQYLALIFPTAGDYIFRLSADGQEIGQLNFEIVLETPKSTVLTL
jgi:hypothetical protein